MIRKRFLFLLFFTFWMTFAFSQEKFIKLSSQVNPGADLRILPSTDGGFVTFALDSLILSKFDACGNNEWIKRFAAYDRYVSTRDFIGLKNGGYGLLIRSEFEPFQYSSVVIKLNELGAIVWAKKYEDTNQDQVCYTLMEDANGNLLFYGNTTNIDNNSFHNFLTKVSPTGTHLFTRFYNLGGIWGGATLTSDGGMLLRTGNRFIKTNKKGDILWASSVWQAGYWYYAPIEVDDGYIFTTTDGNNGEICFTKLTKEGDLAWMGRKRSNYYGRWPFLRKAPNGNLIAYFNASYGGKSFPTLVKFDQQLNVIDQVHLANPPGNQELIARDLNFSNDGHLLLTGLTQPDNKLFVAKIGPDLSLSCDTLLPPLAFEIDSLEQEDLNVNVTNHSFNTVNQSYVASSSFATQTTLCLAHKRLDLGPDTVFCANDPIRIGNQSGDVFETYFWSNGQATPTLQVNQSGTYSVLVTYNCGENILRDTIEVIALPVVEADLGEDTIHCDREPLVLGAPNCLDCQFLWSNGSSENQFSINEEGVYWLTVFNANGCIAKDTLVVNHSLCIEELEVANVFTPNGDGFNDLFLVTDPGIISLQTFIYDRWGHQVFHSNRPDIGWDGGGLNEGVYFWTARYQYINGNSGTLRGTVTLLR